MFFFKLLLLAVANDNNNYINLIRFNPI